jgi:hypothetical protein
MTVKKKYQGHKVKYTGGKNFENAPKFKSSPQNNDTSAALLKQMLCGTSMYNKYLSNFNLKIYIAKQESRGRNLNFGEILNFFHRVLPHGISAAQIHGELTFIPGSYISAERTLADWAARFTARRHSVEDGPLSVSAVTLEFISLVE